MKQKNRFAALGLTLAMALSMGITASASSYYTEPTYDFDDMQAAPSSYLDSWVVRKTVDDTTQYGIMNSAGEMVVALSPNYIMIFDGGIYVTTDPDAYPSMYLYQEGSDTYGDPLPEYGEGGGMDFGCLYDLATGMVFEANYFITLDDEGDFRGSVDYMELLDEPYNCTVAVINAELVTEDYYTTTEIFGYGAYVNGLLTTGDKYFDSLTIASSNMLKAVSRYGEVSYVDIYGTNLMGSTYEAGTAFASQYDVAAVKSDGLWGFVANPLPVSSDVVTEDVTVDVEPVVTTGSATATASPILLNGESVDFDAYFIADNNYFKLRDIAAALDGTGSQFSVEWVQETETIDLVTSASYESVGGELALGDGSAKTFTSSTASVTVNGNVVELTAYNIDGNNYFKLRDLGDALGFEVDWEESTNTILIETAG